MVGSVIVSEHRAQVMADSSDRLTVGRRMSGLRRPGIVGLKVGHSIYLYYCTSAHMSLIAKLQLLGVSCRQT